MTTRGCWRATRSSPAVARSLPAAHRGHVGYGCDDTHGVGGGASSRWEEMHKLHNILNLHVALNGETEERDEVEPEKISLSSHLTEYQIFMWWI